MTIFHEAIESLEFKRIYVNLKKESFNRIAKCFSADYTSQSYLTETEAAYLITVASLLVNSTEDKHTSISSRIANHLMESPNSSNELRAACSYILSQLTVKQSVKLAKKKGLISKDIESQMPASLRLDLIKNDINHNFSFANKKIAINSFQKKVIDSFNSSSSIFISGPTSAGKSFILLRLLIAELISSQKKFSCFIVPTRALVKQVQEDIITILVENNIKNIYVTSVPKMPSDDFIDKRKTIFIFTQERLTWLLNSSTSKLEFERIIVDEIHKIGDGARGLILESTLRTAISSNSSIKSAFSGPNIDSFNDVKNTLIQDTQVTIAKSEVAYIPQNLLTIDSVLRKPRELLLTLYVDGSKVKEEQFRHYTDKISLNEKATDVIWRIAEETKGGSIIYVNLPSLAEEIALELAKKCRTKDNEKIRSLDDFIKSSVHQDYKLRETIKHGVGFHYGNMPSLLREELESQFKAGELKYLVCTATLIEGVNLNAKNVFVLVPKRNRSVDLSEGDFWNLAGRAGRLGSEFEGNIICIRNTRKWTFKVPIDKKKTTIQIASHINNLTVDNMIRFFKREKIDSTIDKGYIENLISFYFDSYIASRHLAINGVDEELIETLEEQFENFLSINELPTSMYQRNFGINPCNIHELYDHLKNNIPPMPEIVPLPLNDMELARSQSFEPIIKTISRFLSNEPEALSFINSKLVVNWAAGEPLPKIISGQIYYWTKKAKIRKTKDAAIRETLEKIEKYVRFSFLKYSSCYFEVLKYVLIENNQADIAEQIPDINLWLEFGANKDLEIILMSIGFNRMSAIHIGKLFPSNQVYDLESCIESLRNLDFKTIEIPPRVAEDAKRVIEYLNTLEQQ